MDRKLRVGILFGGKSAEHEVALLSARNIIEALDKEKYDITLIGIDKHGHWCLCDEAEYLLHFEDPKKVKMHGVRDNVSLVPKESKPYLVSLTQKSDAKPLDVIFPVLHGTYGEDGTVQGLLKLADIPFVGASVLGSAIGMDKDVMKRLLREAGIPTAKFRTVHRRDAGNLKFEEIVRELGCPLFIKPANLGSSVGITKVKNAQDWEKAIDLAFQYDDKILVEEAIKGREIECGLLGNENPIASLPGEVIVTKCEFHSYESKYFDDAGTQFIVPADIPQETIERIQKLAIDTYKVLCCEGLARVDCFLTDTGELKVIEINTIPGFTNLSAYPMLWKASGWDLPAIVDRLIELALERRQKEKKLKTTFT
jgi:D-alanine-D-alanine ligase